MTSTLGQMYDDGLFRYGSDKRGGWWNPDIFNTAIKVVNERRLNNLVDVFEANEEVTSDLQPLIKTLGTPQYPPLTFTPVLAGDPSQGGYCDFPSDYWYEARASYSKILNSHCSSTAQYRMVVSCKQHEFQGYMQDSNTNPILSPKDNYPLMVIQNNMFFIYPFIQRVSFTYIMEAPTPYYDYDIISGVPVYLPPNEVHVNSSVLPTGTPSQSVEFIYPESSYDILTDMVVQYISRSNQNVFSMQTALPDKNE